MKYECPVCGYVYDEDAEGVAWDSLPDDWECPICGASKAVFAAEQPADGDIAEQLRRSSAADFGLRGELPYIDAVIAAVNDEGNLLEKEHRIDRIRWQQAVDLAVADYFDINAILSYLVRINIVARWAQLDEKRGREMLGELLRELDGKELINNN